MLSGYSKSCLVKYILAIYVIRSGLVLCSLVPLYCITLCTFEPFCKHSKWHPCNPASSIQGGAENIRLKSGSKYTILKFPNKKKLKSRRMLNAPLKIRKKCFKLYFKINFHFRHVAVIDLCLELSTFSGLLNGISRESKNYFRVKWNTNLMQHCAGLISAESLYMFRAQAPIIRSI